MINPDRPVRVFRNWKHDCYSIMQGGVVRASARQVQLADVDFLVRDSGRRRMLAGKPKNVHAYAVGRLVAHVHPDAPDGLPVLEGRAAFYDPFRFDSFVDRHTLEPVRRAPLVMLDERGLTYAVQVLPQAA